MILIVCKGYKYILKCRRERKVRRSFPSKAQRENQAYQNSHSIHFSDKTYRFFRKNNTHNKKMPGNRMWKPANTIQRTGSSSKKETSEEPPNFNSPNKAY